MKRTERIFLSGGGTAGSVMPLLAVAEHLPNLELHFVGTQYGVERSLIPHTMRYHAIMAGKLRRYMSWRNVIDPLYVAFGFLQSLWLMMRYRPAAVVSAGGFIAVPVVWAAWLTGCRSIVHQQDIQVGLATRLTTPFAQVVTKAFPDIALAGADWIGNPVRDLTPTTQTFSIDEQYPTVFIFGGGTGAAAINDLVTADLCEFTNVIHVTGNGKTKAKLTHPRYHAYELLHDEMKEAYAKADVVVARAGLATISELASLGKPAIIIPMPNTHQQINADYLNLHNAALILNQTQLTSELFTQKLKNLLENPQQQKQLSENIHELSQPTAARVLAERVIGKV